MSKRSESWREYLNKRPILSLALLAAVIFLMAENFFLLNLDSLVMPYFDEVRYIPAGKQFLTHGINENWSQPPLAKLLIGTGIALLGDNPVGWRFMSTVFGSLTLVFMFLWGMALFGEIAAAIEVVLLAFASQILFVQARIASLDIFMMAFITLGMALFTWAWMSARIPLERRRKLVFLSFLSFGLSAACKWFGVVPFVACLMILLAQKPGPKALIPSRKWVMGVLATFLIAYVGALLPLLGMKHPGYAISLGSGSTSETGYHLSDLGSLQLKMLQAQSHFNPAQHPYRSQPLSWPLMVRPTWYGLDFPENLGPNMRQVIVCLGNPLILWGGLLAALVCAYFGFSRKSKEAKLVAGIYLALWLSWLLLPIRATFFYYYFPAAMALCLAIPLAFRLLNAPTYARVGFVAASLAVMLYFYPMISGIPVTSESLHRMLWLKSWL